MILCIVAGLVLSMNTATMDGSRALYGIAKDGMTIRQLGTLNRYHVPAVAMTIDAILNILLITRSGDRDPGGGNWATSSRPVRRSRPSSCYGATGPTGRGRCGCRTRVPLGALLAGINFVLLIGGFIYSGGFLGIEGFGYGWDKTRVGLLVLLAAFVLYLWRHLVQDKLPVRLREEVPPTPEEEARTRS